jgi:peptidoglycan-associated lipoprotein
MLAKGSWILGCLCAATAIGCGGQQAASKTQAVEATMPTAANAATRAPTPEPTEVSIAPDIVKACGLKTDKAFFAFDSSKLRQTDTGVLDDLAVCFSTGPLKGRSMHLVGHADPRGETEYNFVLGQARADSVAQYLEEHNVASGNVVTTSRGELDATGTNEATWAHDRRVDVMLEGSNGS